MVIQPRTVEPWAIPRWIVQSTKLLARHPLKVGAYWVLLSGVMMVVGQTPMYLVPNFGVQMVGITVSLAFSVAAIAAVVKMVASLDGGRSDELVLTPIDIRNFLLHPAIILLANAGVYATNIATGSYSESIPPHKSGFNMPHAVIWIAVTTFAMGWVLPSISAGISTQWTLLLGLVFGKRGVSAFSFMVLASERNTRVDRWLSAYGLAIAIAADRLIRYVVPYNLRAVIAAAVVIHLVALVYVGFLDVFENRGPLKKAAAMPLRPMPSRI